MIWGVEVDFALLSKKTPAACSAVCSACPHCFGWLSEPLLDAICDSSREHFGKTILDKNLSPKTNMTIARCLPINANEINTVGPETRLAGPSGRLIPSLPAHPPVSRIAGAPQSETELTDMSEDRPRTVSFLESRQISGHAGYPASRRG